MNDKLDDYMSVKNNQKNSPDFGIEIDFKGIFDEDSCKQNAILDDLLELRDNAKNEQEKAINGNILHTHYFLKFLFVTQFVKEV